ncbi:MAG: glycosyltransferase [Sulfitobacter sp.]
MKHVRKVLHLVDDTTAGGVMRVLDFLRLDEGLAQNAEHKVQSVTRGAFMCNLGDADVIVSHLAVSWRSLPALAALRMTCPRTPLVHVEHSYTQAFMMHNVPNRRRFVTLLKLAYSLFNRIVCVSNGQANWMVESRLVHTDKLFTIQSCVDLSAFRALPLPSGPARVFGAIGRLDEQKGFDTLIKAFRQCTDPDIRLHIIGEGAQEEMLRSLAQDDKRIVFRGFQADPVAALADVDVVLMPSRWEAYGLVAIEALAAGRKVVCHDIDGLSDHARHGGVMIDATNIDALGCLIAEEAHKKNAQARNSIVRDSRRLEKQFRDCWRFMLREVGI